MEQMMRGVYVVMQTPYTNAGDVDVPGLRRLVELTIQAGCHGIVSTVNAGECSLLNDEERRLAVETIYEQTAGRVPIVVGISGKSDEQGVQYAKHAQSIGAAGIMSMPPYVAKCTPPEAIAYYKKVDDAVDIPFFIQNFFAPLGTPLTTRQLYSIISECRNVKYIKEESGCPSRVITELWDMLEKDPIERFQGFFCGLGGNMMLHEISRGCCGVMPAPYLTDIFVDLWNLIDAGEIEKARNLHLNLMPLLVYDGVFTISAWKAISCYRGLIDNPAIRRGGYAVLDEDNMKEIDGYMQRLEPYLRTGLKPKLASEIGGAL